MPDEIKRTTLMVRDAERAAEWYATVFGMRRWFDSEFVLSDGQLAAGEIGDRTRLIIMQCKHERIGMIGLLQWLDPPRPAPDNLPAQLTFGAPIFVVAAQDVRATTDRALAAGSRLHSSPHPWSVQGADGVTKHMIGASFWDLDGYFFEVNEVTR
ncbi:MAG: VOC family protein [Steroidobacteraceae bacterium]